MIKQISLIFSILFLIAPGALARITDHRPYGPLPTRSQNPLYLHFVALPLESAQTLNRGQMATELQTTFSNVFEYRPTGDTRVNLDMEIWRTALTHQFGMSDHLDLKIEMPFLTTSGGFLDAFVQGYHDAFGFPNGGRQNVANGQFSFTVMNNGTTLADYPSTGFGFGDMTLRAKYLIPDRKGRIPFGFKIALVPTLKLPTGQASKGLGSGYTDFGAAVLLEKNLYRFHFVTQLGGAVLSGHNDLDPILRNAYFQFGQSVEFQIMDGWSAIVQITGNTSVFKNVSAPELSQPVVDLNLGFAGSFVLNHKLFDEFYYQASFGEDVTASGPSVDFSLLFLAGVRY